MSHASLVVKFTGNQSWFACFVEKQSQAIRTNIACGARQDGYSKNLEVNGLDRIICVKWQTCVVRLRDMNYMRPC